MVFRLHLIYVLNTKVISSGSLLVCYTAVFSVVTLRIPDYLSDVIERVQKRALRTNYPDAESYTEALQLPNLKKRTSEIHDFCVKSYMDKMKSKDHPLQFLLRRPLFNQPEYNLRKSANRFYLFIESIKEGR